MLDGGTIEEGVFQFRFDKYLNATSFKWQELNEHYLSRKVTYV